MIELLKILFKSINHRGFTFFESISRGKKKTILVPFWFFFVVDGGKEVAEREMYMKFLIQIQKDDH